jgi:hypothetical protein
VPRLPGRLVQARRRIETVIGQLVERYHAKWVWARDAWHLWSRWQRKLLSHTLQDPSHHPIRSASVRISAAAREAAARRWFHLVHSATYRAQPSAASARCD